MMISCRDSNSSALVILFIAMSDSSFFSVAERTHHGVWAGHLQTLQALTQGTDATAVVHEYRDALFFCHCHGFVSGLVGYLVGKDYYSVSLFDAGSHATFRLAENMQIYPLLPGHVPVLVSQTVHASNQNDAH
jgi:hypothetical protein